MNSSENHGFSYFKVKMSCSTPSSSGYHKLKKPTEKNVDIYKLMAGENLLTHYTKVSTTRKALILAM